MRFSPPPLDLPAELTWLLAAAFGPELPPGGGDPENLCELARRFDLAPRIVARHGAARLEESLGETAAELVAAHRRAVALGLAAEGTALQLARLAAAADLEIVFLKGYAMLQLAAGPPGWRPFADLDVLLPREQATRLHEELVAAGWAAAREPGNPQHLPPVGSPQGTPVDIHFRLRGVRVGAERWASAEELLAAGLCRPAGLGAGTWVPRPTLLAAHLAVHALEQHGHRPGTYPLLRAVADILDLAEAAPAAADADIARLVGADLAAADLRALFTLGRVLAEGRLPRPDGSREGDAETLLRHIAAGALDPVYRRGLAVDHTAGRLRQARRDGELMRYIGRKLTGPGESPEAGSEGSATRSGSIRRLLLRPLSLCARFAAAAAARLQRALDR